MGPVQTTTVEPSSNADGDDSAKDTEAGRKLCCRTEHLVKEDDVSVAETNATMVGIVAAQTRITKKETRDVLDLAVLFVALIIWSSWLWGHYLREWLQKINVSTRRIWTGQSRQ